MWYCVIWSDHWHRYVLNFLVILYLYLVLFDLWFNIMWMGNLSGLFFMLGVDWVVGVVVVVVGVRGFLALWVLVLYFLIYIYCFECAGLWVHGT
jgi:hypothetical protein